MATRPASETQKQRMRRAGGEAPAGWVPFLRGHGRVTSALDEALRRDPGLTLNEDEGRLQLGLPVQGRMRGVARAEPLLIPRGGVTRLLAGLERDGLVERASSDEDARVVFACLTEAGAARVEAARRDHLAEVGRTFADRFSAAELAQLDELLSRLAT